MASMTDVIFLLLVFFMVTSTFVFPTALDIELPQGTEQTPLKPSTKVYIDADGNLSAAYGDNELRQFDPDALLIYLKTVREQDPECSIAIYADVAVPYGKIVDVLNMGAANNLKMVLATRPSQPVQDKSGINNEQSVTDPVDEQ